MNKNLITHYVIFIVTIFLMLVYTVSIKNDIGRLEDKVDKLNTKIEKLKVVKKYYYTEKNKLK